MKEKKFIFLLHLLALFLLCRTELFARTKRRGKKNISLFCDAAQHVANKFLSKSHSTMGKYESDLVTFERVEREKFSVRERMRALGKIHSIWYGKNFDHVSHNVQFCERSKNVRSFIVFHFPHRSWHVQIYLFSLFCIIVPLEPSNKLLVSSLNSIKLRNHVNISSKT